MSMEIVWHGVARRRLSSSAKAAALLLGTSFMAPIAAAEMEGADRSHDDRIEEVTVVARKRSETLQAVPIPVTVLSSSELARDNLVNFDDFKIKFPAFSVFLTNPKQLNLGIRGIGNNGFNTDGIDGSVGVFVDGVYTSRLGIVSNDFNDLEQVELLRGPQGTLFGKNTTAGAVIINSRKPSFTPELRAEATGGSEALQQYKVSVSGPLTEKWAARLSVFYSNKDGNYRNVLDNSLLNARQGQGAKLQLLGNITDSLTVRLIASHTSQSFNTIAPMTLSVVNPAALQARMAAAGYPLIVGGVSNRILNINAKQQAYTRASSGSAQFDWDLGGFGQITSITGYQNWYCHTYNDNDFTQIDAIRDYGSCNKVRQFSQELRWATTKDGPIDAVGGVFVSSQNLTVDSRVQFGNQYQIFVTNPSATVYPSIGRGTWANGAYANSVVGAGFQSRANFHTDTEAAFGNVNWHPDSEKKWTFGLGLRATWESRRMDYSGFVVSNPGQLSQAQLNALSPGGANAQLGQATDAVTDFSFSGQANVTYQITPDVMVYAGFARGHKSKGFNLLPQNSSNPDTSITSAVALGAKQDVAGERADNIEVGIKSDWFDKRLRVNATLFDTLVKNYQANIAIGTGSTATRFLANVGFLRSRGAELEVEALLAPGLRLKGFVAYDRAKYASFRNSPCPGLSTALFCDLTGRQVAWTPKFTSDLSIEYAREVAPDVTLYGVVDENWRSDQNTTITLDPTANIKAYALTDLRVGALLRNQSIDVQFWVRNLFDKGYFINLQGYTRSTGITSGYPGNPRTLGVTVRLSL